MTHHEAKDGDGRSAGREALAIADSFRREARRRWWLEPSELELYELDPRSNTGAFLSKKAYFKVVLPSMNDPRWRPLMGNKLAFGSYFADHGIRTPRSLGFLAPGGGFVQDGQLLRSVSDMAAWLHNHGHRSFVVKSAGGGGGGSVIIIEDIDWTNGAAIFLAVDGRELSGEELVETQTSVDDPKGSYHGITGYVIQERLRQHPWFRELSGAPSNSLRMVTWAPDGEQPTVQMAVARLGRQGDMVDNWSQGGVAVGIDLDSGKLRRGRFNPKYGGWTETHPDTGALISGQALPYWEDTCALVCRAASLTPGLRSVGWDVVIAEDGPAIVEGNSHWNIKLMQVHSGGVIGTAVGDAWARAGIDLPDGSLGWSRRNWWRTLRPPYWLEHMGAPALAKHAGAAELKRWRKRLTTFLR